MSIISLTLFFIVTIIHLYASLKKDKKLRGITKPFILATLLWWYVVTCSNPMPTMILALVFSWLGDVLLIGPGIKHFTAGGISFLIGHAFFILSYCKEITYANVGVIIALEVFFLAIVCFVFSKMKEHLPKALFYPMALYLMINGTMNCCALLRMFGNIKAPTIITCVGALLFFVSDTALFFVRFKRNSRLQSHFLVMLTYSIGEFLIVLGMTSNIF